jgi:hypothetical protein
MKRSDYDFFLFQNQPNPLIQFDLTAFAKKLFSNQTASGSLERLNQNVSTTGLNAVAPGASVVTYYAPSLAFYKVSAYEQILHLSEQALKAKGYAKVSPCCWKYVGAKKNARKWIYTYADPGLFSLIYECPPKLHFPPRRPVSETEALAYLHYGGDMNRCREELFRYLS